MIRASVAAPITRKSNLEIDMTVLRRMCIGFTKDHRNLGRVLLQFFILSKQMTKMAVYLTRRIRYITDI